MQKLELIQHKKFAYFSNIINENINNLRNIHNIKPVEKTMNQTVKPIKLFELYKGVFIDNHDVINECFLFFRARNVAKY